MMKILILDRFLSKLSYLLLWEFFGATPSDDCLVVYSVLVVLVPKHGVVRNQGEHHHVL